MKTSVPFLFLSHLVGSETQRAENTARFDASVAAAPQELIVGTTIAANADLSVAPRVRSFLESRYTLCARREPFVIYCNNQSAGLK